MATLFLAYQSEHAIARPVDSQQCKSCKNDTKARSPRDHHDSCIYTFAIAVPSSVCMSLQPNFKRIKRNDRRTSRSTTFDRPVVDVLLIVSHRVIRNEFHHLRFVVKSVHRSPQIAHKVAVAP